MKNTLLCCILLLAGATAALAQSSPITVSNATGCAFQVQLINTEDGCGNQCATTTICILPGTLVTITPCNSNWYWDRALITPTYDDCTTICSPTLVVAAPNPTNCLGLPTVASANHCACGPYTANFGSPTVLKIY